MESEERFDGAQKKKFVFLGFLKERSQRFLAAEHYERYRFATAYTKGKRVLDMACGSGYGSDWIARSGAESVTGADKELSAVEEAKKRYQAPNLSYVAMDAEQVEFPQESFDVVLSFEKKEHIEHPEIFLERLKGIVKKDGTCIFSTPNRNISNPGTTLADQPANPFHIREYVQEEFVDMLQKYFVVEHVLGQGIYMQTTNSLCRKYMNIRQFFLTLTQWGLRRVTRVHPLREGSEPTYMVVICKNLL